MQDVFIDLILVNGYHHKIDASTHPSTMSYNKYRELASESLLRLIEEGTVIMSRKGEVVFVPVSKREEKLNEGYYDMSHETALENRSVVLRLLTDGFTDAFDEYVDDKCR